MQATRKADAFTKRHYFLSVTVDGESPIMVPLDTAGKTARESAEAYIKANYEPRRKIARWHVTRSDYSQIAQGSVRLQELS